VKFLRTGLADKCDWESGSSTKAADTCGGELDSCTGSGQGSCCTGKVCNYINSQHAEARGVPEAGHYCEDPNANVAAAFEKELKLVEEEDKKCIPDGEGGPSGKCGCLTETGGNSKGTACCVSGSYCSYVSAANSKSGVGGFYCSTLEEEDVAVEINKSSGR